MRLGGLLDKLMQSRGILDVSKISDLRNWRNGGAVHWAKKRNTGYLNEDHMCFTWGCLEEW